jgi:hypothetical protein
MTLVDNNNNIDLLCSTNSHLLEKEFLPGWRLMPETTVFLLDIMIVTACMDP